MTSEKHAVQPPVNETPVKETTVPAATEGKRVLKTLHIWSEIVESIARAKPQIAAFLSTSRAYRDSDDKIIIRFNNPWAVSMLETNGGIGLIRSSLSAELGRNLTERDIIFETVPPKSEHTPDETIFDEIDEINNQNNKGEE